jgi:hypothetical protein
MPAGTQFATKQYHVRAPDSTRSHGPYGMEALREMGEAGKVDAETLYWDTLKESWIALADNSPLFTQVFPGKSKLHLRTKKDAPDESPPKKEEEEEEEGVSVDALLAAANAESEETRHLSRRERNREQAARIIPWAIAGALVLSGASLIIPQWPLFMEAFESKEYGPLLAEPFLYIGIVDLVLGLFCGLGLSSIFPLVRLRVALGLGYFGYVFWSWQEPFALGGAVASAIGLFALTLSANLTVTLLASAAGIGGALICLGAGLL